MKEKTLAGAVTLLLVAKRCSPSGERPKSIKAIKELSGPDRRDGSPERLSQSIDGPSRRFSTDAARSDS
jgi:hypothetical protein